MVPVGGAIIGNRPTVRSHIDMFAHMRMLAANSSLAAMAVLVDLAVCMGLAALLLVLLADVCGHGPGLAGNGPAEGREGRRNQAGGFAPTGQCYMRCQNLMSPAHRMHPTRPAKSARITQPMKGTHPKSVRPVNPIHSTHTDAPCP